MNLANLSVLMTKASLSLAEKGTASLKVILTGFVVVFAVLLFLILIIKVYGAIIIKATTPKKKMTKIEETAPVVVQPKEVANSAQNTNGVSDEVVAVISAAVATMYSSPEKVKIKSIKKSDSGRSAWANAGVLDNTRPF